MEAIRQYAVTLIIGALICAVIQSMTRGGPLGESIRLLCSIFLSLLLLMPLLNGKWYPDISALRNYASNGSNYAMEGERMASQSLSEIITAEMEAYIQNMAAQKDTDLLVTVRLDEKHLPVFAELKGTVSDQIRRELSEIIETDLGIAKENQQWTG